MSEVKIIHFPQMEIAKNDLVMEISGNEGYIGRIYISRGSIDFLPKDKQYNPISLSWDKFARVMDKLERKRRKKSKKKRVKDKQ